MLLIFYTLHKNINIMERQKYDISNVEKKYKMGDIHPKTGMIFGHYTGYHKSGEQWYSPKTYEKRMVRLKEYRKTEKFKQYSKKWYENNKERVSKIGSEYHKKRKTTSPLSFIYRNTLASIRERRKKGKNIEFNITKDFLRELWDKQNGKCFYTGIEMEAFSIGKHPNQPSLDRRNSEKGYVKENVVLCCQSINFAKSCYTEEEFVNFLNLIKITNNDPK